MFAKLKKKIQVENGSEAHEKEAAVSDVDGLPGVHMADHVQHSATKDVLTEDIKVTSDKCEPMTDKTDVSLTKSLMTQATTHVTSTSLTESSHLQKQVTDLLTQLCDKNTAIEKLESALAKQQEISDKKTKELSEQCNSLRVKMSEAVSMAVQQKDEETKKLISELRMSATVEQSKRCMTDGCTMTAGDNVTATKENNSVLAEEIEVLREENKQLSLQIDQLIVAKQQQQQTILVEEQLEQHEKQFQVKEQQLQAHITNLNEQISGLQSDVARLGIDKEQLTEELQDKSSQVTQLTATITGLSDQVSHLKVLQESHDGVKATLERRCQSYQQEVEQETERRCQAELQLQRLSDELNDSQRRQEELDLLVLDYQQRSEENSKQLRELEDRLGSMSVESESQVIDELRQSIVNLEDLVSEKNKVIKKQEQLLGELKKTLQRELRVQPLLQNSASNPNLAASGVDVSRGPSNVGEPSSHVHHFLDSGELSARKSFEAATLPISENMTLPSIGHFTPDNINGSSLLHPVEELSSDRVVGRSYQGKDVAHDCLQDINFRYLRHVVVKFLISKETEALQLIRALTVLLHLSEEEQQLIRETLEWKISWFGTRPQIAPPVYQPRVFQTP